MTKPKGSVTISQKQMMNCVNHWQILDLMEGRGVPFDDTCADDDFAYFKPHPDYTYTEHVDYDNHTITVTWSLK